MKKSILILASIFCLSVLSNAYFEKNLTSDFTISSSNNLGKLKRRLLKNLIKDNFIESRNDFAKIELPKGKIIINGKELTGKLFQKYESILLTFEVKHGENRAIHICKRFIKEGEFFDDCFRGRASGTVTLKVCDDGKNSKSFF
ncbi:MAG: hypothetical protein AB8H03_08750 [Saprospiraceae bacterium]